MGLDLWVHRVLEPEVSFLRTQVAPLLQDDVEYFKEFAPPRILVCSMPERYGQWEYRALAFC